MNRVFIIDDDKRHGDFYPHLMENNGFEVFATENAFNFVRYASELHPDMYIINSNLSYTDYNGLMDHLIAHHFADNAPLVVMYGDNNRAGHLGVSHYLHEHNEFERLPEIAGAYCLGGGKYDVLLLDDYLPWESDSHTIIKEMKVSFFDVYDLHAAQMFLRKNMIRSVVIHSLPEKYESLKRGLGFENTFYVENLSNLEDLAPIIQ